MSTPAAAPPVDTLEPTNQGDPNAPDILAAMDAFFDGPNAGKEPVAISATPDKSVEPSIEPKKVEPAVEPTKAPEPTPTPTEELPPLIDEGFGKADDKQDDVKDLTAFDEAAFDAQTELEVKGMEAKAGEKFKALKAELKAFKLAAQTATPPADLLKRVEEAELKAKEAEGLRERLKVASAASAKLEVENDDNYIREVKQPWNDIHTKLDKLSEVYDLDPSILRALVREEDMKVQDEMIKTHLANFSDIRRQEVFSAATQVPALLDKHEAYMKNAEADFGARQAKQAEETERLLQEQRKAVQMITQDKWKRWEAVIPGLLDDKGQPTADYARMKNESLSIDFSQSRAGDQAFAALAGTLLPFAQREIVKLQRKVAEYEKADKKATDGNPSPGSSITTVPATKPEKSFMERMAEDIQFTG